MNNQAIITKAQKDLYHVTYKGKEYLAKARGLFREKNIRPLVGDRVEIQILEDKTAYIEDVYERRNSLVRPPVANVDQIILISSLVKPKLNYTLFDKYLVMLEHYNIPVKIVINKVDLAKEKDIEDFILTYENSRYDFIFTSAMEGIGIDDFNQLLKNKISALAGPSGVGKSSILNLLAEEIDVETGILSSKTSRGKHTTRHVELFPLDEDTFILDTPGFSALDLSFIKDYTQVKNYFPEIRDCSNDCKFSDCQHINEPKCMVKEQVEKGLISQSRFENYKYIREEIKNIRRY